MPDASLLERLRSGDTRALARAISLVEDGHPSAEAVLSGAYAHATQACLLGVTGPPGAGKSTLVSQLAVAYRKLGVRVAIFAVDPSSPFTGGAILGDRVRMQDHATDPGVFIRSMATRGHLGGLARATADAAALAAAAGFDLVIIETVGVGQDEVDIVRAADICVVTLVPGTGDDVQALKAGVMEIADIFVVNKADREGADRAVAAIEAMLALDDQPRTAVPVVQTVATTGAGVQDVVAAIERQRQQPSSGREDRQRFRADARVRDLLIRRLLRLVEADVFGPEEWKQAVDDVAAGRKEPFATVENWVARLRRPTIGTIDHVGVATGDDEASRAFFEQTLGLVAGPIEAVGTQGVNVQFLGTGETRLELVTSAREDSPIARFLASRGPGLHHIAIRVQKIDDMLARLRDAGVRLIDAQARPGAHGTRVAFIHPSSACGVLVELVEKETREA